ncbi:MAG: hypothetical protein ACKO0M_07430 [Cyanobium sp.]
MASGGSPEDGLPEPQAAAVASALARIAMVARELEGRPEALLALLRSLEQLHRTVQDGAFRASLPSDRNALFQLLSEMERSGGWPYIPRLQLRTFLDLLGHEATGEGLLEAAGQPLGQSDGGESGEAPRLVA